VKITPLLLMLCSAFSAFAQLTSGPWSYTVNEKSEVTITGYSGSDPSVVFPKEIDGKPIKTIGEINKNVYPFTNKSIKRVTLPEGVVTIRNNAFINCRNLTEFNIPSTVKFIEGGAFVQTGVKQVFIPASVVTMGPPCAIESGMVDFPEVLAESDADNCFHSSTNLASINVEPSNAFFASKDGVLFKKDIKTLVAYPSGKRGSYTIPQGVTNVGPSAFGGAVNLTRVAVPREVARISEMAFEGCENLENATLAEGLQEIGTMAFARCVKLQKIEIPATVTNIASGAFLDCVKLKKAVIKGQNTAVADDAFPPSCQVNRR
jgi:hypothetical protein